MTAALIITVCVAAILVFWGVIWWVARRKPKLPPAVIAGCLICGSVGMFRRGSDVEQRWRAEHLHAKEADR